MQQSNFTINDGQTTPVAQVFTADGSFWDTAARKVVARWINRAKEGIARFRMDLSQRADANANGYKETKWTLVLPTMEPIVGGAGTGYQAAPKVAYYNTAELRVVYHERSTAAERKDLVTLVGNFTATSQFRDLVMNDERMTG